MGNEKLTINYSLICDQFMEELHEFSKSTKELQLVGCLLHLQSSNEPCQYCAASIVCEFHSRTDENFVNRCKLYIKETNPSVKEPFFVTLFSYSRELSNETSQWRLPGVSAGKCQIAELGQYLEGRLDLEKVIRNSILPLWRIPPNVSYSNALPVEKSKDHVLLL